MHAATAVGGFTPGQDAGRRRKSRAVGPRWEIVYLLLIVSISHKEIAIVAFFGTDWSEDGSL